jgi:hypothetical protein
MLRTPAEQNEDVGATRRVKYPGWKGISVLEAGPLSHVDLQISGERRKKLSLKSLFE